MEKPNRPSIGLDAWVTKTTKRTPTGAQKRVSPPSASKAQEERSASASKTSFSPKRSANQTNNHRKEKTEKKVKQEGLENEEPSNASKVKKNEPRSACKRQRSSSSSEPPQAIAQRKRRLRVVDENDDDDVAMKTDATPARKNRPKTAQTGKPVTHDGQSNVQTDKPAESLHADLPLENMRVVVTGQFESVSRQDVELHVKRLGGHVTSAVSGRTDMLVTGAFLEDGRACQEGRKYKEAISLREGKKLTGRTAKVHVVEILDEQQFVDRYPLSVASRTESASYPEVRRTVEPGQQETQLWSEKWRPQNIKEIIGNDGTVKKLLVWLKDWRDVCVAGNEKESTKSSRFGEPERINARAALLSGPPGVGKTTAARVAAKECGYEVLEYNASDDRNKGILEALSDLLCGGVTMASFMGGKKPKHAVLVMDEMDGLSGNSDRGGVQTLMKLIAKTNCPIICICNDRMHPKLRSLLTKCYDLRFHKPPKNVVSKRMVEIAQQEGLDIEYNAIELLCERVGNDLRQILNTLQLMGTERGYERLVNVSFDGMRKEIGFGLKDNQVMANPFDAATSLLCRSSRAPFNDKLDLYFVDHDLIPLLMEENYISAFYAHHKDTKELDALGVLASVADCFSFGDVLNSKCRKDGCWSLLTDVGLFTAIVPACQASGFLARPEFPKWLGKNSTTNKNKRLLTETHMALAATTSTNQHALRTSGYLDLLYEKVISVLKDEEGIRTCVEMLNELGLTKDQLVENIGSLRLKRQARLYDLLSPGIKRIFTTTFNSSGTVRNTTILIGKRKPALNAKGPSRELEGSGDEAEGLVKEKQQQEEEVVEDVDAVLDRLFLAKKARAKQAAGASKRAAKATTRKPRAKKKS